MCLTGRPSKVHFLAARGSLSSGKPFVGKAFPTKKIGAFAASNVAQGSCAHQTTKLSPEFSFHAYVMTAHRSEVPLSRGLPHGTDPPFFSITCLQSFLLSLKRYFLRHCQRNFSKIKPNRLLKQPIESMDPACLLPKNSSAPICLLQPLQGEILQDDLAPSVRGR